MSLLSSYSGLYLLLIFILNLSVASSKDARIRVVSVFRDDEIDLHKYSAVLAAVEPFRLQMERDLKRSMNPVSYCYHKLQG